MKIIKYISKILNRISLIGKFVHLYRIKKAKQILKKIKEINAIPNNGGRVINYLRKINPYVFEELVLSVIENSNVRVIRNKSYSNDGGIDGIFKLSKGKVLVQCKRYKSYINPKDVMQLSQTVKEQKYYFGIFVHTGKTGEKSKDNIKIENNTMIISGSLLINFLVGNSKIIDLIEKKNR
jgi:restriction system protein